MPIRNRVSAFIIRRLQVFVMKLSIKTHISSAYCWVRPNFLLVSQMDEKRDNFPCTRLKQKKCSTEHLGTNVLEVGSCLCRDIKQSVRIILGRTDRWRNFMDTYRNGLRYPTFFFCFFLTLPTFLLYFGNSSQTHMSHVHTPRFRTIKLSIGKAYKCI